MRLNISSDPSDRDMLDFLVAFAAVEVFLILFLWQRKYYDVATAAFFAFGLGLMARGKLLQYLGVFALANFNRETTILLTGVFMVNFLGQLPWRKYLLLAIAQVLLFLAIRAYVMMLYADLPGTTMLVRPIENLALFMHSPIDGLAHWAGFGIVIWLCARRWKHAPRILRVAFVVMLPASMILYLVLGWAYEIRVFAEIYPVVWVMVFKTVTFSYRSPVV
jgi:hypothetical protein